jgi:hypothetical protein
MEQIKLELEGAYNLAEETRASEEKGLVREKELQGKVRAAEEQRKLSDLVVLEYADLVRSLEGRPNVRAGSQDHSWSNPAHENGQLNDLVGRSTPRLVDGLSEGKIGLQKLFSEFNSETTHLHSEIDRLTCDLAVSFTKYDAQMKSAERDRDELAKAKFELEKLRMDDGTAAKMVSRYM